MLRKSISRQVLVIQWIAVTLIVAGALILAVRAWNDHGRARAVADLAGLDRTLFEAVASVRLEIGTVGVAILRDDDSRAGVAQGFDAIDSAVAGAEAELAASAVADRDTLAAAIAAAQAEQIAARIHVLAEGALPRDKRETARIEPWRMAVYALADAIDHASTSVGRDLRALDVEIGELAGIRQRSFTIRDRYSRQCSAFRSNVQTDTPLSPSERDRWREDIGAYTALWAQMARIVAQLPEDMGFAPRVAEGLRLTAAAQAVMTRTLESLGGSGKPAFEAAEWSQNCISAYESILGIGRHALDLEIAHAQTQRMRAFAVGAASTALLAVVVVLGVASLAFIRRRLSEPMQHIQSALARLNSGDFATPVAVPAWDDEPSAIAEALERFRLQTDETRRMRMRIDQLRDELVEHAEKVGRTKSQFLAAMSHEIRTPLHGILGVTQLLARSPVTAEQRVWVAALEQSGQLLRDLIDDILDFTRLEGGHISATAAPFEVRERLAMVETAIGPAIRAKGLGFDVAIAADVPVRLVGDAGKLSQVLLNLLGNAAKFTEHGGVRLAVGYDATARRLRLAVSDTGIGIAPEARSLIFEPFRQAEGAITRRYGGSGLGLAICRGLLDILGGSIAVDSTPGVGTTFTVFFPAAPAEASAPEPAPEPEEPLPPLRLLVAEDNPVNALILRTMLEQNGHRVDWVETGSAAVTAAAASDYDVVLMDLAMPGLDGASACRQIRAIDHATRAVVPILAVSAGGAAASDVEAGFDGRLEKPFRREDLVDTLAVAIGLRPRRPPEFGHHPGTRRSALGDLARDLGIDGARKVVALYLSSQPVLVRETLDAVRHGDRCHARALAHRLKGAAGHVGAIAFAGAALELEAALAAADGPRLATAAATLEAMAGSHFAAFAEAAEAEIAGLTAGA